MKKVTYTIIEGIILTIALMSFPLTLMAQAAGGELKRLSKRDSKEVIIINDTRKQENSKIINVSQKGKGFTSCPDSNHPHMINLGLPSGTLWACCNVGTQKPEDYGGYYAWGETKTKSTYNWGTYSHCGSTKETCRNLGSNIAGTAYDVATANWGTSWRMPTIKQLEELKEKTTSVWTTQNGVKGRKFTGANGGIIFLPAAGYVWDGEFINVGSWGYYWSSTSGGDFGAYQSSFYGGDVNTNDNWSDRDYGLSVRPVRR